MEPSAEPERLLSVAAAIGLAAGLCALLATMALSAPAGMPPPAWGTLGLALLMAIWWSTEPVPIAVTALMPLIVLPLLGVADIAGAAAPYADSLVFLFLGGFLLGAGIKRWGLHKRLAHSIVRLVGSEPRRLVLGFMAAVGFLSMWISNTAAVVLMLPVAASVITITEEAHVSAGHVRRFGLVLLLAIAYAASIGGVGTLIGTPPNALLAAYLRERHGMDLSFAAWSAVAMPLVLVFLPLAWLVLTRLVYPIPADLVDALRGGRLLERLTGHGAMAPPERRVALVFVAAAALWITRPLLNGLPGLKGLSDPGIALICACALFLTPSGEASRRRFLLSWQEAKDIPWQVLLLFGGGLSLASAMDTSGLAAWIGQAIASFGGVHPILFLLVITATVLLLTELASNTATVAALLPIAATLAAASGMDVVTVSSAVAMAASCAFMLPVATPPNALVFATGHVTVSAMVRAGVVMNLLSIALVSLAAFLLSRVVPGGG